MKELIDKKTGLKRATVRKLTEKHKDLPSEHKQDIRKHRKLSESSVRHAKKNQKEVLEERHKAHAHMKAHGG